MIPRIIRRNGYYLLTNITEDMLDYLSKTAARFNFLKAVEWCDKMNSRGEGVIWYGMTLDEIISVFGEEFNLSNFVSYVDGYLHGESYVLVEKKLKLTVYRAGSAVWGLPVSVCMRN